MRITAAFNLDRLTKPIKCTTRNGHESHHNSALNYPTVETTSSLVVLAVKTLLLEWNDASNDDETKRDLLKARPHWRLSRTIERI